MSSPRNTAPTTNLLQVIPTPLIAVLVGVALAGLVYAILSAHLFLWFASVFWMTALVIAATLCILFYRLVVAVEHIADQL